LILADTNASVMVEAGESSKDARRCARFRAQTPLIWIPMTRRRWIADEVSGRHAALTGYHAEHLSRVLRARHGQEFDIGTPAGVYRGRIVKIDPSRVEFELGAEVPMATAPEITLALAVFKFDRMEWAIEKCTELGVARLVPVIASRSEKHLVAAASKRVERWQRIAREASEQSRRISPPEIPQPMNLKDALALPAETRIVLAESENELMLTDALQAESAGRVALAIGPEGGWTEPELTLFRSSGWLAASLGETILRSETAAIAAAAITLAQH
jgi:16S rRNA (uracil1498-N3)-methyltransferase